MLAHRDRLKILGGASKLTSNKTACAKTCQTLNDIIAREGRCQAMLGAVPGVQFMVKQKCTSQAMLAAADR